MKNALSAYFEKQKIEYFDIADCRDLHFTNSAIIDREGFTPKSAIIYLLPYYSGETVNISRYAASLDYHIIISEINRGIRELLLSERPSASVRGYGDHSPIDERHAALVSGLGILGDSGLLINEKYGSYVFVADVLTDIEPTALGAAEPCDIRHCEGCGICRASCPTGILRGESGECLSAITQRKGELSDAEISLMMKYNTVWGCDECQSACPHNLHPELTPIEFFYRERIPHLSRSLLDSMDKAQFSCRAFAWRGRKTVERNLHILENANIN